MTGHLIPKFYKMKSEDYIIISLLRKVFDELVKQSDNSCESQIKFVHPKFGEMQYLMNVTEIVDKDFPSGTLALIFTIQNDSSSCRSRLVVGNKEKVMEKIDSLIRHPEPLLKEMPDFYRILFDYPTTTL